MQKFIDCDYVLDRKGNFYIVRGYWNDKVVLANKVFSPDKHGNRYNFLLSKRYEKVILNNFFFQKLNKKEIGRHFKPKEGFVKNRELIEKEPIWGRLAREIENSGVPESDIGIFGSYLLGFHIEKDIDFVVYGKDNCKLIKKNIKQIIKNLNAGRISPRHIEYQTKKYTRFHSPNRNSFPKLLANKWSSIQIAPGLLATIRFVYNENEIPEDIFSNEIIREAEVKGKVVDCFGANFCPRYFSIKNGSKRYTVGTYFWAYQACVSKGMIVKIKGNFRENNCITIDGPDQGIMVVS